MSNLAGKVVWITGASSGIGEALVYLLAQEQCKLIISARRKSELERVKNICPDALQGNISILPVDLEQTDTLTLTAEAAANYYGHVDILVNNAGISQRSPAEKTVMDVYHRLMNINYFGTITLTKGLLPSMLSKKGGHIVVISSLLGKFGIGQATGYAASKHALHGFFDSLRAELWEENIHVTMVCPGFVKTNVSYHSLTADGSEQNLMDAQHENAMSAEACAKKIVKAIKRKKEEVYIGKQNYAIWIRRFSPALFSYIQKRVSIKQK